MNLDILILEGDGIGPEVTREAVDVLRLIASLFGHKLQESQGRIGAAALEQEGSPLPASTRDRARQADAILLGAVGMPAYDDAPPHRRPERGLLDLRQELKLFANLRPVRAFESLLDNSPLKNKIIENVDLLVVRELTGGLYYGQPRGITGEGDDQRGFNTMVYSRREIGRIAQMAFKLAKQRKGKVTSVDKSNVLETSQLWRQVVNEVAGEHTTVEVEHMLVDNCAMQLILNPRQFDVLLTENMFGDILSDEGAVLAGSIGMLASASIGERRPSGVWAGLYEPVHGSAPDIAGADMANPLGAIASVAAMLEFSFGLSKEAAAIAIAIESALRQGIKTADLHPREKAATTSQVGAAVRAAIQS